MLGTTGELKQYHHVRVDADIKEDYLLLLTFIEENPNSKVLCKPFIDLNVFETSRMLNFYTDSSTNKNLRFGYILKKQMDVWTMGTWICD